uniref:non-specific serine/threonine protein kinase n=1 Tax=Gouania willdenowi TaxID=441366 RepID=A0A8C5DDQ5_GOUWI
MDQNAFGGVPRFLTRPKAFSVCAGKDATLSCAIVGSPTPLITWEKGKLKLTSGNRFQTVEDGDVYRLTIYDLTLEDSGQYMCRAKNSVGEAYAAVTLKVALPSEMSQRAPVFMVKPSSTRVLLGGDVVFHSRVAAHPEANFEWEKDGRYLGATNRIKMVSDSDTSTLKIQGVRNLDAGTYTCRAQNVVGRAHAAATLVVDSLEYELRGKHAKLSCFVTGHPKPHIMWRKDGGNINEGRRHVIYEDQAENFILKILYCKQADNGLYTCNATNMAGETYSAVLVTVKEPKVPFRRKLQDVEVQEKMSALLLCEVPQIATRTNWFMEETRLEQNNKYRMEEDGTVRRLTIHNVTTNDDGVYICEMNEGSRTVAELTVLGNITKKLPRRTVVPVSDTVIFCVELEQPCPDAYWTRNGEKLKEDARIAIGYVLCQYTLTIRDCQADDSGEVAFMAGDCKTSTPARKHPPDPPINAVVQNKTDSSITIHWSPPDTERPVPIKGYVVEKRKVGTQTWQRCNASQTITSTQVTVCSFSEEASYQFRISAMNDFGQSPYLEVPGSFYLEPTAHVTHGLTDSTAINGEEFSISVQLSAVCSGFWSLNGRLLRSGADFLITRSKSTHTLLIRVVTMEMNGAEVKFVGGGSESSCVLSVKGKNPTWQRGPADLITSYVELSCEVSAANASVLWRKDLVEISEDQRTSFVSKGTQRKLIIRNAKKADEGTYSCETAADKVTFQVKIKASPPVIFSNVESLQTAVQAVASQSATLSCSVADSKTEVKWLRNGKQIISSRTTYTEVKGHTRRLVMEKVEKSDAGEYYVCEVGTERMAFRLQVEGEVGWLEQNIPSAKRLCVHENVLNVCEVSDPKVEVKWYKDGKLLKSSKDVHMESKGHSRQLVIEKMEKKDVGEYTCEVGTERLSWFSNKESVQREVKAALSHKASLSCEVADAKTEVKWYKDGKLLSSTKTLHTESKGRSRQLLLDSVEKKDAGEYVCEVGTERMAFRLQVEGEVGWLEQNIPSAKRLSALSHKASLSCEVADAKTEVKWYKDGKLLSSTKTLHTESKGRSRQLLLDSVEKKDAGEYVCEVGTERMAFRLQVLSFLATKKKPAPTAALSHKASLSCEVADAKTEVKWYKDGKLLSSTKTLHTESKGRSRQLLLDSVEKKDAGEYVCEVGTERMAFRLQVEGEVGWLEQNIPSAKRLCVHENVLNVCEVSDPKVEVKWYKDGKLLKSSKDVHMESKGHSRQLVIEKMEKKDVGEYTCEVGTERLAFRLQVEGEVGWLEQNIPSAKHLCVHENKATLSCEVSDPKVEVKWYKDGKLLKSSKDVHMESKGHSRQLVIEKMEKKDVGEYTCEVGTESCATLCVRLSGEPVMFKKKLENLVVEEQSEVHLQVELSRASDEVRWMKNSVVLQPTGNMEIRVSGTKQELLFKSVTQADRGFYSCETLDDKTQAKLSVEGERPPRKVHVLKALTDTTAHISQTVTLEVELSQPDVEGTWTKDGTKLRRGTNCLISALGPKHTVTLSNLRREDAGLVSFTAEGVHTSAKLLVTEPPAMISKPLMDVSAAEKEKVTLECEVSPSNADVHWFKVRHLLLPVSDAKASVVLRTLVISKCSPEDAGVYVCRTANDNTSATLSNLEDVEVMEKESATFVCELSHDEVEGQWFKGGSKVKASDNVRMRQEGRTYVLLFKSVSTEDVGEIRFTAEKASSTAKLTVKELPVKFVKKLRDKIGMYKHHAHLECQVSRPSAVVHWFKNKTEIKAGPKYEIKSEGVYRKLTINDVDAADEDTYVCDATDDRTSCKLLVEGITINNRAD